MTQETAVSKRDLTPEARAALNGAWDRKPETSAAPGTEPNKGLPVLKPVQPIAVCGHCGNAVYPDGQCQSALPKPNACCLNGEEWRQMKAMWDMRNQYIR